LSIIASHTREQLRQSYCDAWRKHLAGAPLTPLEALIADVVGLHPEYQPVVEDPARALGIETNAAHTAENPFLHMGLHLAVGEQLSIDRPPGVRDLQRRLQARLGSRHDAEHALTEALAETLWEAQRTGHPPDEARYLALARSRLSPPPAR
jgi:hypothetical protein